MSIERITFIRPNMRDMRASDAMEPMVFAILASLTPSDIALELYDERLEPIPRGHPTDLVAMTVETYTARRAYQIAAGYRARGIPVVMGGYHPTLLPAEALQYCDAVVLGDAEAVWGELLDDARRGRLQRVYQRPAPNPLVAPQPMRQLFAGKRYVPLGLVQYGRGCRFACDFCSIHAFYGKDLIQRPVSDVVAEIESLNRRVIFFVDDNLFSNARNAEALFRALIPLKVRWSCQVSIDIARNDALLALMEKSGCKAVLIGFESLNEANLQQMKKKWNLKRGDYATAIRKFQDRGLMIYGTFVFGYDHDTVEAFDVTVDFAVRSGFYLANFNPLTPTPGTALYERLKAQRRLLFDRWWLDPAYRYGQATFQPVGMTPEDLTAGCLRARRRFYEYGSMLRRAVGGGIRLTDPYHVGIYALSNLISRREIRRKQDIRFGDDTPLVPHPEAV